VLAAYFYHTVGATHLLSRVSGHSMVDKPYHLPKAALAPACHVGQGDIIVVWISSQRVIYFDVRVQNREDIVARELYISIHPFYLYNKLYDTYYYTLA
jgi:hypothetical protein